ncbi:hypothetical protein [Kitasatospora aureofaciens]|uniref:hypothetical protein n=1 Tax=Kitasatospora aureofaciens TaxID=1894 RepID=UPI001C440FD6|nr:hypothetical protein [Kitasatospora aureofaciens]MBV6696295.1 hypothetical protein [Kitasatospora aureofaciens]
MKSKLAKAALTATAALALAGAATPAFAHVGVAGGTEFVASADQPFAAQQWAGVAHTSHILTGGQGWGAATDEDVAGGAKGFAHLNGWR